MAAAAFLAGCTANSSQQPAEQHIRHVPVTEVRMLDTTFYHEYVAGIQAVKNIELRARVSGFLEEIYDHLLSRSVFFVGTGFGGYRRRRRSAL